jgi:hypothetical protein
MHGEELSGQDSDFREGSWRIQFRLALTYDSRTLLTSAQSARISSSETNIAAESLAI